MLTVILTGVKIIAKQDFNLNEQKLRTVKLLIQNGESVQMEDKRIVKTKRSLKATLVDMLSEQAFEQISITELCRRSDISRITFYSHYNDKYALVDEIFQDMAVIGTRAYEEKQKKWNPQNDEALSYCNILDAIMELYYENFQFFKHTAPDKNPYLAFAFYSIVLETVERHTIRLKGQWNLKYSAKKIAGFLCYGIIGFINESHAEKTPLEQIQREAKELLIGILRSEVLLKE